MDEMISRPALPMIFDVQAEPALFLSVYKHLTKPRVIYYWVLTGCFVFALGFYVLTIIASRAMMNWRLLRISCFLLLVAIFTLVMLYKRIRMTAQAQARLTGELIHYEITEEGVFASSQDGYNYKSFAYLYKVIVYPDMWFLYFGEKSAPTIKFVFKSAFPDPADQAAFEALLNEKLAGKPMIYKT